MTSEDTRYIDYDLVMAAFRYTVATVPNREQIAKDFASVLPARDNLPCLRDLATRYEHTKCKYAKEESDMIRTERSKTK